MEDAGTTWTSQERARSRELSSMRRRPTRRTGLRISPRALSRRWIHRSAAADVPISRLSRPTIFVAHRTRSIGHRPHPSVGKGVDRLADRVRRGPVLLESLAVSLPAARAGSEASTADTFHGVAERHRFTLSAA